MLTELPDLSADRPWQPRWERILPWIPKEPGIALDIGAAEGAFALQLAELGWKVYAVEPFLDHIDHPNIRWFHTELDARTIATFPYRVHVERFDLVLGLSILHWLKDYGAAYWAMRKIGQTTIIETPHPWEHRGDPAKELRFYWLGYLAATEGVGQLSTEGWSTHLPRWLSRHYQFWPEGQPAIVHTGNGYGAGLIPTIPGIADALGYQPFPGTIDHHLEHDFELPPPPIKLGSPEDCWSFWPVTYMGLPAHICGHPGWEAKGRACDLVGPVPFREVFGLRDGDTAVIGDFP